MQEAADAHLTFDLTIAAARAVGHPGLRFCYVSGEGADSSERGRTMWARVKGKTENALLRLPLQAFMFRPGFIRPLRGAPSRTPITRAFCTVMAPLYPLLQRLAPRHVTTTAHIGRAMIQVAQSGYSARVLETPDINLLGA